MKSSELEFRRATQADVEAYYGGPPPVSMVAMVALQDGVPIAIGGVSKHWGKIVGFSEMKPAMRSRKKDILRFAKLVMELVKQYNNVVVFANPEEANANVFITWLGFRYVRRTTQGEMYTWEYPQQ